MNTNKLDPLTIMQTIALAILEAINVAGVHGAHSTVIYAALQVHGASLDQYQSLMNGLLLNRLATFNEEHYVLEQNGIELMNSLNEQIKSKKAELITQ